MQTCHRLVTSDLVLAAIGTLHPLVARIERHDRDLGQQLRRAGMSAV